MHFPSKLRVSNDTQNIVISIYPVQKTRFEINARKLIRQENECRSNWKSTGTTPMGDLISKKCL